MRKVFPVTSDFHGKHWFVRQDGRRYATPLFVCLAAIVAADIAFAVDSIPAAFAITRDSVLIWMANVFALLGLRALFVLVEGLIRRFRYLDETIAIVLGIVAVKLLIEDLYKVGPVVSLAIVFVAFAIGIVASLIADRRDPDGHGQARRAHRVRCPATVAAELAELALDLGLHVERLLALRARGARCARPRARGPPSRRPGSTARRAVSARELGLDVERRLALAQRGARCGPRASGGSPRRARPPPAPAAPLGAASALVAQRQPAAADLVVGLPRTNARRSPRRRDADDHEDDDAERVLHPYHCPMWRSVDAGRWRPRRPRSFPGSTARAGHRARARRLDRARDAGSSRLSSAVNGVLCARWYTESLLTDQSIAWQGEDQWSTSP